MNQVKEIKDGNRLVYSEVFENYNQKLYQYIYRYTQSPWLAEETVQLSFIKLWEKRETLSETHDISTQLFRIAKSTVIDLLRKEKVRDTQELSDTYISAPEHERLIHKETLQQVLDAMEELPDQSKQVFTLSRLGDLSHKEIGTRLSISPKTIEGHITKALKYLRKNLASLFF